jgi:arylsulfatase A-like enzyme
MLQFPNRSGPVKWSEEPDIFSEARALGINTSLVGWYHPYCRIEGSRLTSCYWQPANLFGDPDRFSIVKNFRHQAADLLTLIPFTKRLQSWLWPRSPDDYRTPHLAVYQLLIAAAKDQLAADRNPGLTFIHLPVPHPPYIYDRQRKTFDINGQREYSDNLALADHALGELRETLERAGLWDKTTIIVSSDHWWRTDFWKPVKNFWSDGDALNQPAQIDHRIPLIVHVAGQKMGMTYEPPLNTVLTHDLVLELLKKGITKPEEIKDWFDRNRTIGESPYQTYGDEPSGP